MADIWSEIGVDITKDEGEWLYKVGSDMRGPMPHRQLVDKLLVGEIDLNTLVAREGTTFHPLHTVAAFASHLENARQARAKREAAKSRKQIAMVALPVVLALIGAVMYIRYEVQKRRKEEAAKPAVVAVKPPPPEEKLPQMGLVALVSLGEESDVKIRGNEPAPEAHAKGKRVRAKRLGPHEGHEGPEGPEEPAEPEEEVQSCKLTQQDIFGTLRSALGKLNVCVEDEKKRDTQGLLPPALELGFVVKPNGKVVDFAINDRHYRTGPLNNCMIKAFNTITFPSSTGANCPITIPIKIGK